MPTSRWKHRVMLRWFGVGLTLALLAGCKNANCEDEVTRRLQSECQLVFGGPSAASCLGKAGAPTPDSSGAAPELDTYRREACEIADPPGERECYLTSSCQDVAGGVCTPIDDRLSQAAQECVLTTCLNIEQRSCGTTCGEKTSDWESCKTCLLDCTQAQADCEAKCRSKA